MLVDESLALFEAFTANSTPNAVLVAADGRSQAGRRPEQTRSSSWSRLFWPVHLKPRSKDSPSDRRHLKSISSGSTAIRSSSAALPARRRCCSSGKPVAVSAARGATGARLGAEFPRAPASGDRLVRRRSSDAGRRVLLGRGARSGLLRGQRVRSRGNSDGRAHRSPRQDRLTPRSGCRSRVRVAGARAATQELEGVREGIAR